MAEEALARGLPANLVYLAGANRPFAAAVTASSAARLGGLLLLEPGADRNAVESALASLDLASSVDRIVVVDAAPSSTNWVPIALAVGFVLAGAGFLLLARRRARERSSTRVATA